METLQMNIFTGLSAFPLTPADDEGVVDTDATARLVERLVVAGVDSVSVLGSTGIYAYLENSERSRAVSAAVEAAAGRVPVVAGVGALRTGWSRELAVSAERSGASGLIVAPMSYAKLNDREVAGHFAAVAGATGLPLCIYNNPGTTKFDFSYDLIAELAKVSGIKAAKLPPLEDGDYQGEISELRSRVPETFRIGYTGDWCGGPALLTGADAWHSAIAGILPEPAIRLTRAAIAGDTVEVARLQTCCAPMWDILKKHGSLRVIYGVAEYLGLEVGEAPLPLQAYVGTHRIKGLSEAVEGMMSA
jgi:4-hydroxy-tetrahydrodipicolinate synthase